MTEKEPIRFGSEFGPKRTENSKGVGLSTYKTLVWVSNLGGLILFAIGLELIMVLQQFYLGFAFIVGAVIIAVWPSNYEIVGMEVLDPGSPEEDSNNYQK